MGFQVGFVDGAFLLREGRLGSREGGFLGDGGKGREDDPGGKSGSERENAVVNAREDTRGRRMGKRSISVSGGLNPRSNPRSRPGGAGWLDALPESGSSTIERRKGSSLVQSRRERESR